MRNTRTCLLAVLVSWACAASAQGYDAQRLAQQAALAGPRARAAVGELQTLFGELRAQAADAQLAAINRFFNRHIGFATDAQVWHQEDFWASPLQSLAKGAGDCEDYAIAKYFGLLAVGVPASQLRLVYVRARLDNGTSQAHMVLAYYPPSGDEVLVLDNLAQTVAPASRRADLTPVFSFNSEGLWMGVGATNAGNPVARLSRWREVLVRARAEGWM